MVGEAIQYSLRTAFGRFVTSHPIYLLALVLHLALFVSQIRGRIAPPDTMNGARLNVDDKQKK